MLSVKQSQKAINLLKDCDSLLGFLQNIPTSEARRYVQVRDDLWDFLEELRHDTGIIPGVETNQL